MQFEEGGGARELAFFLLAALGLDFAELLESLAGFRRMVFSAERTSLAAGIAPQAALRAQL